MSFFLSASLQKIMMNTLFLQEWIFCAVQENCAPIDCRNDSHYKISQLVHFHHGMRQAPTVLNLNSGSWITGAVKPRGGEKAIKKKNFLELICGTLCHNTPMRITTKYKSVEGQKLSQMIITSVTWFKNKEIKTGVVLQALIVSPQAKQCYFEGTNKQDFK